MLVSHRALMSMVWLQIAILVAWCNSLASAGSHGRSTRETIENCGEPLLLTPFIERGDLVEAVQASEVHLKGMHYPSYSGFLEVDKAAGSNLFFWFFTMQDQSSQGPPPLILWLQGGPGASGLFGLFAEIGPYAVDASKTMLLPRPEAWNREAALLFVDSPVGTGFSFTQKYESFARNEAQIGQSLLVMLKQFFVLFPHYQRSKFYIFGESYGGGKYAPALAVQISKFNQDGASKHDDSGRVAELRRINLQGLGLGDPGVADPAAQLPVYADELYNMGLVDKSQREVVRSIMSKAVTFVEAGKFADAFALWDSVWGDVGDEPFPSLYTNFTFSTYTENLAFSSTPPDFDYYVDWLNTPAVRRAIHVGSLPYGGNSSKVYNTLAYDAGEFMGETLTESMVQLLREYRVVVYSGTFDPLLGTVLADAWINKVLLLSNKHAAQAFAMAPKHPWYLGAGDTQLAGYSRESGNLTMLAVRNSGHVVPHDQPRAAYDIMRRMVHGHSFKEASHGITSMALDTESRAFATSFFPQLLALVVAAFAFGMGTMRILVTRARSDARASPLLWDGV